ncbi:MAG: hypothetical protein AABY22_06005 [Nanoarchaeota archaeon]
MVRNKDILRLRDFFNKDNFRYEKTSYILSLAIALGVMILLPFIILICLIKIINNILSLLGKIFWE